MITREPEAWLVGVRAKGKLVLAEGCGTPGLAGPAAGCPAEGSSSSRQVSSCLINPGLANTLAACRVEVNHKTGQVPPSVGKGRRLCGNGQAAWERGFPLTGSSSASQNRPVTLTLSRCLFGFSALCVYANPAMFFRCACVQQQELLCASCWVVGSGP